VISGALITNYDTCRCMILKRIKRSLISEIVGEGIK
jgi:hypothetical protein